MGALNPHIQQHLAFGAVHIVKPLHHAVNVLAGRGDGGTNNSAGHQVDGGVNLHAGFTQRGFGGSHLEARHRSLHGLILCSEHTAQRAGCRTDNVLRKFGTEGGVIHRDDLLVDVALVPHLVHPRQCVAVAILDRPVFDLAAIVGIGVEVIDNAPCHAEVAQPFDLIGAEGDFVVLSIAVEVGGLDAFPVGFPVFYRDRAFHV